MPDETPDRTPDARDTDLAAALAVPPLDEVTRRRLVAGALAATDQDDQDDQDDVPRPAGRRSWVPLVAAVFVILAVVVGVFALTGSGGNDSTTASRAPAGTPATAKANGRAAADAPESAAGSVAVGVADYGDLGNLSRAAARRRARTALATAPNSPSSPDAASTTSPNTEHLLQSVANAPCAEGIRAAGDVVGVASATFHDHDAVVVVVQAPSGVRTGYLLVPDPCSVTTL